MLSDIQHSNIRYAQHKVFVGCSTESLHLANALATEVQDIAVLHPFDLATWGNLESPLSDLLKHAKMYDAAVFIFRHEDVVVVRETEMQGVRDNVLFEFGLFVGHMGTRRTFFLREDDPEVKRRIPSDIEGIYSLHPFDSSLESEATVLRARGAVEDAEHLERLCIKRSAQDLVKRLAELSLPPADISKDMINKLEFMEELVRSGGEVSNVHVRYALACEVIEECRLELQKILTQQRYSVDISLENSFIVRGRPIFEAANVYATSIDRYSSFWTERSHFSKQYLASQPRTAQRLFVFSTIDSCVEYRDVLLDHFDAYGEDGRVYLIAWDSYKRLIKEQIADVPGKMKDALNADFAILRYDRNEEVFVEARLNKSHLTLKELELADVWKDLVVSLFDRMNNSEFREKYEIVQFSPSIVHDRAQMAQAISFLWKNTEIRFSDGQIQHIVLFSREIAGTSLRRAFKSGILDLKAIHDDRDRRIVKKIWFGRTDAKKFHHVSVVDEEHGATLKIESSLINQYPYCLVVEFETYEAWLLFMGHSEHCRVRRQVYRDFNVPDLNRLYDRLDRLDDSDIEGRRAVGQEIESEAQKYLVRMDFERDNDLSLIAPVENNRNAAVVRN